MRRVAVVFAFALVAAGLYGPAGKSGAVAQAPAKSSAVLALVEAFNGSRLVWLDPATLRPLKRASVALPPGGARSPVYSPAGSPVFSPAGRYIALGGLGSIGVRIVDLRQMRVTARVAAGRYSNRRLVPLAWPDPRRLLVLDSPQDALGARQRLLVVDPVARRTVARFPAEGWTTWARAGRKLVVLMGSETGLDAMRLAVLGPGGGVLGTADVRLPRDAGSGSRAALPGFTVSAPDDLAFMVGSETVAKVDLETLEVSYLELSESRSFLSRVFGWLEPAAQAKELVPVFSRQATWLGNGSLAVSGASYESGRSTPSGLQLIDTRTGAVRTLEPRASAHRFSQGLLLAFGADRDGATNVESGMGVSALTADGAILWHALDDEPVWLAETAAGYAYVPTPVESFPPGIRVIDLAIGAVIRTVRGEMPTFVVRD